VRVSTFLAPLALGVAPSVAMAAPSSAAANERAAASHLLERLVESERAPLLLGDDVLGSKVVRAPVPRPALLLSESPAMDCVHAAHDITLDPRSGVTKADLELRVKASGKALGAIGIVLDEGLEAGEVKATDRKTTVADALFAPSRVVRIDLSPAISPGEEAVISVPYAGTLSCARPSKGAATCSKGASFSYFAHKSIFPYIFDPEEPESVTLDALTREIILRLPADNEVVVTGQKVSQLAQGPTKVSTWTIDRPLSRTVGLYALVGDLGLKDVESRNVPATFVHPPPEKEIDRDLVAWSGPVLDFVERVSGARLPFERGLSLVRLPKSLGDPGTATFGMTLLSDSYASAGTLMYEETWAHENAHLIWGIVVPETDPNESRLMSEGIATLTQLDYSYTRHFASEDRDEYLARRFVPMGLDLLQHGADLPPPQLLPGTSAPADFRTTRYTLWAYFRNALALDHLRATIGDDVFADVLRVYGARCRYVGCTPDTLREIASETSGKDMRVFFDRWITANERPRVVVGFTPGAGGAEIELTKRDTRPMTLELWLGLADGSRSRERVDLGAQTTRLHLGAPAPVVSVRANPRHDVLVDVRSAVDGDLDFDGETDGFDILRCARLAGQTYATKGAAGLWNVDETFDPRCDIDGDLSIDDDDLDLLAKRFGKLRAR
jgi:hypothetical protein